MDQGLLHWLFWLFVKHQYLISNHCYTFIQLHELELKLAASRLETKSNKKTALMKQTMHQVAMLLMQNPSKEEQAYMLTATLMRDEKIVEVYELLKLECELLANQIQMIDHAKRICPEELKCPISDLIFASRRVGDIDEFHSIRKQFRAKFGKSFEDSGSCNKEGVVNERLVKKLSQDQPHGYTIQIWMKKICSLYDVSWTPVQPITQADFAQTIGFAVQVF